MPTNAGFSRDYGGFDEPAQTTGEKKPFEISLVLQKRILVIICFFILALCLPLLLYLDAFDENRLPAKIKGVCLLDQSYRISCGKINISEANCTNVSCCFDKKTNSCYHHEPSSYFYYQKNDGDFVSYVSSRENTPIGLPSVKEVKMNYFEDGDTLRIFLNDTRTFLGKMKGDLKKYDILDNDNKKLSITVYRKNTTEMLLTTLKGPLIVNHDYLEWTIQLTNGSGTLFGLGQLKIDSKENSTVTKVIYKNQDDHNTLPMFMAYNNGKYHAVLVHHEGVLEVSVLPSYLIYLKTLYTGTVQIQIIDGPTPKDIYQKIRKQQEKPKLFSEWIFGLHICREEPVENMKALSSQYTSFIDNKRLFPKFTYASECIHDDLLLHLIAENYTLAKTKEFFEGLGIKEKIILSYPPQIPMYSNLFEKFKTANMFYQNETDGSLYVGKYKNFDVVYPKYTHNDIGELIEEIIELFQGLQISGLTFTNSWPQDDNYEMRDATSLSIDNNVRNALSQTIPWNMMEGNDLHARYHNKYGSTLAAVVKEKFGGQLLFSPVSDYNLNQPLILQNLNTSWTHLRQTLEVTLFNSLFGQNFLANPTCGSNSYDETLQEDLCLRWYLLSATMPLIRVSSRSTQRTPVQLNTDYTMNKVISVLETRQSFIPYYRALLTEESPLVRPMFFNFPEDVKVHALVEQYMIGDGILVAQPMSPDLEIMKIYLPPNKVWYEIWGGERYQTKKGGEWIKFPIVKSDWVSFILEGHIISQVKETSTGPEITLKIAMKCKTGGCQARGSLLFEEYGDELIHFSAVDKTLSIVPSTVKQKKVKDMIKTICIYDYNSTTCSSSSDKYIIIQ